jgi:antitoxin HicB
VNYTLVIQWSDEDQTFVVLAPEWADLYAMPVASGKTYTEAAERGRNALEHMIEVAREDGVALPHPKVFAA